MNLILKCESLSKKFSGSLALSDVNLTLERGGIVGLLGPNGSGKSTLLKIINGLLVPDSGKAEIAGMNLGIETKK